MRRRDRGDFVPRHLLELTVALPAPCVFQGHLRAQTEAPENLEQLIVELIGPDQHRSRAGRCQLAITGHKPSALGASLLGKRPVLQTRLEENGVVAEKPQPARQRSEHGVAEEARMMS